MASTDLSLRQAFVLSDEMTRRVCGLLERHIGPISINVRCADGVQREFSSADLLLEYDNLQAREILSLRLSARSDDLKNSAVLTIASDRSETVGLSISAPSDALVVTLRQESVTVLEELRPWYARLATLDFVNALLLLFLAAWAGATLSVGLGFVGGNLSSASGPGNDTRMQARAWSIVLVLAACAWGLNWLRDRLFPAGVFAIGEGKARHRTMETVRWSVVIGLAISALGSLLVSFFV